MFKTFLNLHHLQIRISHMLSRYIWYYSVLHLIPDQTPHTHTYCFLSKSLDSNLFYAYPPLHLPQLLQVELRCLRRMQEEQQVFHSCPCTSYCRGTRVFLWGTTAELGWAKLFLLRFSFLVGCWHLFHWLSLTNTWAFLFSHKRLPVLCVVGNLGIILYYILLQVTPQEFGLMQI